MLEVFRMLPSQHLGLALALDSSGKRGVYREEWQSGRMRRFAKSVMGSNPSAGSNPVSSAEERRLSWVPIRMGSTASVVFCASRNMKNSLLRRQNGSSNASFSVEAGAHLAVGALQIDGQEM